MHQNISEMNRNSRISNYQERSVPKFLKKIFYMLEENKFSEMISWSNDGSALIIKNPTSFANEVLPLYFKHSNFSSFIRQLNMYKFKKTKNCYYDHIYTHPMFQRGRIDLLRSIQRKTTEVANLLLTDSKSFKVEGGIDVQRLIEENMHYKRIHKDLTTQVEFIEKKMRDVKNEVSNLYNEQKESQANEKFLKNVLKSLTKAYGFENIAKVIENEVEGVSESPALKLQDDCFEIYSAMNNTSISQFSAKNCEESDCVEKIHQVSSEYQLSEPFSTNDTPQQLEKNQSFCNQDNLLAGQPLFLLDFGSNDNINNDSWDLPLVDPKYSRNNSYVIWVDELKNKDYNSEMLFHHTNNRFMGDLNTEDF